MKRTLGALLLILGLIVPPLQVADAAPQDQVKGKPCYDITVDALYFDRAPENPPLPSPQFPRSVFAQINTAKLPCADLLITLAAFDQEGLELATPATATIADVDPESDGTLFKMILVVGDAAPDRVCVEATSQAGTKLVDIVPNAPDNDPNNPANSCERGMLVVLNGGTGGRVSK